ncbi:hypothetical protein [Bradyrhizobium sp. AZCC 2289]|uniref:hypothetical protein n=1 Tax=Bradyrhizobium sp. AZCC 2289 TaxID=3117026 RepID=UPI002FF210BC
MWRRARIFGVLLAIACVTCPEVSVSASDTATKIEIGKSAIGAPPAEFEFLPLSEAKQGSWTVVRDATAKAGIAIERVGAQSAQGRPPLAIYKPTSLKNAEISLRLNAAGGKLNQGGGVAVRLSSPQDYYLVQLDALRDTVLLSLVENGLSKEIVTVDADISSRTWHTLTVRAKDDQFIVSLDGTWVFTGFDKTLSQPGRIALWTEGDSITRFDGIVITPLPKSEEY